MTIDLYKSLFCFLAVLFFNTVQAQLSATVAVTNTTCGQNNGSAIVTPAGSANYTYQWSAGGSSSDTDLNLAAGVYTVTVYAGPDSVVSSFTIGPSAGPAQPVAGLLVQPTCGDASGSFIISNYNNAYTYSITPSVAVTQTDSFVTAPGGSYVITATGGGCQSSSVPVVLNPAPGAPAQPTVTLIQPSCAIPAGIIIITNYSSALSYTVSPAAGVSRVDSAVTVPQGTFSITAVSAGGCVSSPATGLSINSYSASYYSQSPTICQGQALIVGYTSYSSPGYFVDTLVHAAADGCDSIVQTTLTVIQPYPAYLSLYDTCTALYQGQTYHSSITLPTDTIVSALTGCDSVYLTVVLNVFQPAVTTTDVHVTICPGDSFFAAGRVRTTAGTYDTTLTSIAGCDSIILSTHLSILHPQYIHASYDTCYPVTVNGIKFTTDTIYKDTVTSVVLGCDSLIYADTIHVKASPITVLSSAPLPITLGDTTALSISPPGVYHDISWSPNQWITNRFDASPLVLPDINTAYSVTLTDTNGCVITGDIVVTVRPYQGEAFAMPSAFTPNGDGVNDLFGPVLYPSAQVQTFRIYDRWGMTVFDKDAAGTDQWDGACRNIQQAAGTYTYFISILAPDGAVTNKEGNFMLLR